ncbi:Lrp/AsnC family transcriptional regulator [Candidatus Thorarchaeota archaeon]|nr:MAG: Lrp/AsnC family transcriptional regulator [Candidatus Thorarchaeota archaeon]
MLSRHKKIIGDWTSTLLTLRNNVRSHPAGLGRALDIPKSTALYRIRKLEEDGLVLGYTPEVIPSLFGSPYLVQVLIDSKLYQFQTELESTIAGLVDFLKTSIGHAPLTVYVQRIQNELHVNCITMTTDIEALKTTIYRKQNMARDAVTAHLLDQAHGIPMYHQSSTIDNSESASSTETGRRD